MDNFTRVKRILFGVLLLNWLVAFSKIIYGFFTNCASMSADGFHSFGDGASNLIGLIGIYMASRPKDESHPYGHKKFETMATLGIAGILFFASFNIIARSLSRIFYPEVPDVTVYSFAVMIITIAINFFVMKFEKRAGETLSSDILICDSMHTRSDILASVVVIGTLISIKAGFPFIDTIVASLIALFIAKTALDILKRSSNVLCDANVLPNDRIASVLGDFSEIKSVHNVRTRGRADDVHVDLHAVIDGKTQIRDAHELTHRIEERLKNRIKGITDVIVHLEPTK